MACCSRSAGKVRTSRNWPEARPPYLDWKRTKLPAYIGGPLLAEWGGRHVVGGRRTTPAGPKTTLYWLENDVLVPFAELPSAGDNSYPGLVTLDDGRRPGFVVFQP